MRQADRVSEKRGKAQGRPRTTPLQTHRRRILARQSAPEKSTKRQSGGGLERAIAEGNVVITQDKLEADGATTGTSAGREKADYNAVTGEIILSGNARGAAGHQHVRRD